MRPGMRAPGTEMMLVACLSIEWRSVCEKIQAGEPNYDFEKRKSPVKLCFRLELLGNPPRNHIELCPSPEERPAHLDHIAIRKASGTIIGF